MKYEKIEDTEGTAKEVLAMEALRLDEIAFQKECMVLEMAALQAAGVTNADATHDQARIDEAKAAREQANLYIRASEIDKTRLRERQLLFLNRWQEQIEMTHLNQTALRKVKSDAGLPVPDHDSQLATLEVSHKLAKKINDEISGSETPKAVAAPRRAGGRAARR